MIEQNKTASHIFTLILIFISGVLGVNGCSLLGSDVFILPEYENDPSRYYVETYIVKDERVEYNDRTRCELDRFLRDENYELLVTISARDVAMAETKEWIYQTPRYSGIPVDLQISITCIGLYGGEDLGADVDGKLFQGDKLLWQAHGTGMSLLPSSGDIDWNSLISAVVRTAVSNCLSELPYSKPKP